MSRSWRSLSYVVSFRVARVLLLWIVWGRWTSPVLRRVAPQRRADCGYLWLVVFLDFVVFLECYFLLMLSLLGMLKDWDVLKSKIVSTTFSKCTALTLYSFKNLKATFPSDFFFWSLGGSFINGWCHLNSIGASGGQIIGWKDNIFECSDELVGEFLLLVRLTHRRTRQDFVVTSAYKPCTEGRLVDLWHELRVTRGWTTCPWLLAVILMLLDILARGLDLRFIFQACVISMILSDLCLIEPSFLVVHTLGQMIDNLLRLQN